LLSLVLLIAQLGVEAHAYSHLSSDPHGVPSTVQSCAACVSVAPLLSMAGGSHSIRLPHQPQDDSPAPTRTISIAFLLPCPAFRSRAPPDLL
jgi:hypothetical protein